MKDIILPFTIGSKQSIVTLTNPQGGQSGYFIVIEKILHGTVNKMSDGWHVYLNNNSFLTAEDCEVILERVRENE